MTGTTDIELFLPPQVARRDCRGGGFVLSSKSPLQGYPDRLTAYLDRWAGETPDRTFLAERGSDGGWSRHTYARIRAQARSVGQALLDRGVTVEAPLMILSDNSVANAIMQLGALYAGVPFCPVSPAYSLMSSDFAKLRHICAELTPSLVFADDSERFAAALSALGVGDDRHVHSRSPLPGNRSTHIADLVDVPPGEDLASATDATGPDSIAKILYTSGSTGMPKGVINTHRMLCSNQQAIVQMWPFLERRPPVIVDWLPWNHTFGGNHDFNMILANGGTLYIDAGKPVPGLVERTLENLRDVAPTMYFNVPRGFDMILPDLERDEQFRDHFFSNLDLIFYAAAALPQSTWGRLEALSEKAVGRRVPMTSAWGSTETAPLATSAHYPLERAGVIGVPAPGVEIKMIPNGGKHELMVRGPNVTPGYWRRPDLTAEAFDDDGFYHIGDAGRLEDEADPSRGIIFDGRIAEDFKLLTGTWVNTGALRIALLAACAPLIQDAVITGHDKDEIGALVFPAQAACAQAAGKDPATRIEDLVEDPSLTQALLEGLTRLNAQAAGTSGRVARILLLTEPPGIDANEITDKGYINQRAVLTRRADLVEALHDETPGPKVIIAAG